MDCALLDLHQHHLVTRSEVGANAILLASRDWGRELAVDDLLPCRTAI